MTQPGHGVVRRFEVDVGDQHHVDLEARLDGVDVDALFVEQEGGDIDRHLRMNGGGVFLHRLFLQDAQDVQCGRFGAADVAGAMAARAGDVAGFTERGLQALARQFQQAEAGDLAHLHAGAVVMQRIAQAVFHLALVACGLSMSMKSITIRPPKSRRRIWRATSSAASRLVLNAVCSMSLPGGAGRVDVHRHQRFGVVDHDGAAGRQVDLAREGGFDLVLDLEAREQRHVVAIQLDPVHVVGHHVAHELLRLLVDVFGVDQNFADVRLEIIADGADHQAAFLIDQESAVLRWWTRLQWRATGCSR